MTTPRKPESIAAEIEATRTRLVNNLDELSVRVQPEHIASTQVEKVKNFYLDEFGGIRMDRAGKTAAVILGLAVLRKLFK